MGFGRKFFDIPPRVLFGLDEEAVGRTARSLHESMTTLCMIVCVIMMQ